MTIILCDYPYGQQMFYIVYIGTVTDSANRSSHNNAGYTLTCSEALVRPACNSCSKNKVGTQPF